MRLASRDHVRLRVTRDSIDAPMREELPDAPEPIRVRGTPQDEQPLARHHVLWTIPTGAQVKGPMCRHVLLNTSDVGMSGRKHEHVFASHEAHGQHAKISGRCRQILCTYVVNGML